MHEALLDVLDEDHDIIRYEMSQMAQYVISSRTIKQILVIHELNFMRERMNLQRAVWPRKALAALRWLSTLDAELGSLDKFDAVMTFSGPERQEIQAFRPEIKVDMVRIGVDTEHLKPIEGRSEEKNSIMFSGWFKHTPNVDAVVFFCREILPLIEAEIPTVKFLVVGGDPPPQVTALTGMGNVCIRGYIEDLKQEIARCAVYVAPIVSGAGVRVKVLEAWSMRKAVVSTSLGCQGLDARDGFNIAVADTSKEFARKTIELLRNDNLRLKLGNAARRTVEQKYDWKILIDENEKIHDRILEMT
jgi:glycosyltransferase involved in cell wall biosynthesis